MGVYEISTVTSSSRLLLMDVCFCIIEPPVPPWAASPLPVQKAFPVSFAPTEALDDCLITRHKKGLVLLVWQRKTIARKVAQRLLESEKLRKLLWSSFPGELKLGKNKLETWQYSALCLSLKWHPQRGVDSLRQKSVCGVLWCVFREEMEQCQPAMRLLLFVCFNLCREQ